MTKSFSFNWTGNDEMHIKIKDMSGRIVNKIIVNINDTKKLADCFVFLEKYGVDIDELFQEIKRKKELDKYYLGKGETFNAKNLFKNDFI